MPIYIVFKIIDNGINTWDNYVATFNNLQSAEDYVRGAAEESPYEYKILLSQVHF